MSFRIADGKILIFDGAMGTMLQKSGVKFNKVPEELNITHPEVIESIHRAYLDAGSDVISTNTFGANRYKAEKAGCALEDMVSSAVEAAKRAVRGRADRYVALDIGPCGRVMQPTGDMAFEDAVEVFAEVIRAGVASGVDLILLETFTDLYELKAAVIAAKENSDLPLFATMSFEEGGNTFFGATVEPVVMTLEALGVDALGVNCSLGPKQLAPIVDRILAVSSIPVMVQPNAGLPVVEDGETRYDVTAEEFAQYIRRFAESGVSIVGGCCGTNPDYIRLVRESVEGCTCKAEKKRRRTGVCSPSKPVYFGEDTVIIGERLNPTGKKFLQAALRAKDMDYIIREAVREKEQGAHVLDVNMGLPDIDEPEMLTEAVKRIQAVVDLPLQLDSSNYDALEKAARIYNGKPLINSVCGKAESLEYVLPVVKKYGAAVLGLTLDDNGIPTTAEARLEIAERIVNAAAAIGIPKEDVLIDCLVMTISAQQNQAEETLKAVRLVKEKLGVKTVLGVSNVSFGLPARPIVNRTMLAMALMQGLDAPIMNPGDSGMAETVAAFRALTGRDVNSADFMDKFSNCAQQVVPEKKEASSSLGYAIRHGLKSDAITAAEVLLSKMKPLDIIEKEVVPALDAVGKDYEKQEIFLPQLIASADAAKSLLKRLRSELVSTEAGGAKNNRRIVLATVHGDIHDIGKNIVKVIMENYNFDVIDLGKDVPPEKIVEAVIGGGAEFVGLSALMTTTVASMKTTIGMLRRDCPDVKIIVGGAVLTPELAKLAGADYYAKDAMEGVRIISA